MLLYVPAIYTFSLQILDFGKYVIQTSKCSKLSTLSHHDIKNEVGAMLIVFYNNASCCTRCIIIKSNTPLFVFALSISTLFNAHILTSMVQSHETHIK